MAGGKLINKKILDNEKEGDIEFRKLENIAKEKFGIDTEKEVKTKEEIREKIFEKLNFNTFGLPAGTKIKISVEEEVVKELEV